jgi:hypothetical protein
VALLATKIQTQDIEGSECYASGAMHYLKQLDIAYVAIEWSNARLKNSCGNRQEIFDLFAKNELQPYKRSGNTWEKLDPSHWASWRQSGKFPMVGLFDVAWSRTAPDSTKAS